MSAGEEILERVWVGFEVVGRGGGAVEDAARAACGAGFCDGPTGTPAREGRKGARVEMAPRELSGERGVLDDESSVVIDSSSLGPELAVVSLLLLVDCLPASAVDLILSCMVVVIR